MFGARRRVLPAALLLFAAIAPTAWAEDDAELQKKLSNPIADLVTVPFQWTTTAGVGPFERPQHALNIQPVYPVKLGKALLINRAIVPILSNPGATPGQDRATGLGDITYEAFFVPPSSGGLLWGAGPILQLRTASNDQLGSGKWAAGPAFVVVTQPDPWTVGVLLTQRWSFAGDDQRAKVNETEIQPVLSYRLNARHTLSYAGTIRADWEQSRASQRWTVPLGATYSTLVRHGSMPVNYIVGAGYNVIRPDGGGDWSVRVQVNFILAK